MSGKRAPGRTLCVLIGAQAIAVAALAQQTPDTQRPDDGDTTMDRHADHGATDQSKMKSVTPQSFATQAAVIGKAEVELAQLALQNTKNEEVRIYAERMIKDHTSADQKLKKIAAQENLQLPQSLDAEHMAVKQKLSGLKGDAFDREYKKQMTMGHEKAIALFESASQAQHMPSDLKEFAASTLPTLKKHKAMAQAIDTKEDA